MNSKARRKTVLCFSTILALILCATARAQCPAGGCSISIGTDYFLTVPADTYFNFNGNQVPLMGVPLTPGAYGVPNVTPGGTDTIVQRLGPEPTLSPNGSPATMNTMITALSLESTTPQELAPNDYYNIFATLDQTDSMAGMDTGTLTISLNNNATGGTFTSSLDVYFDLSFTQVSGSPNPIPPEGPFLVQFGNPNPDGPYPWSTTPANGAWLVYGTDDGQTDDQNANIHTGLDVGELDFFPGVEAGSSGCPGESNAAPFSETALLAQHGVCGDPTPEPGSLLLLGTALLGLGILGGRMLLPGASA